MSPGSSIRSLETLGDYRACVSLQREVWGNDFSEVVPTAILKVGQTLGGVTAGAFDARGELEGFVFGLTGLDASGEPIHWSDMLAVRPGSQGRGLATRLKVFQRDVVLARGVRRMHWTFDPLRARNAHFNLNKLGAVVRVYRIDMYGDTDSELHRGIGTDRFVATWFLDGSRVRERLDAVRHGDPGISAAGRPVPATPMVARSGGEGSEGGPVPTLVLGAVGRASGPGPGGPVLGSEGPRLAVSVPSDIGPIMARDLGLAVAWREATREVFSHYLDRGYEVRSIVPGPEVALYVLERVSE